MGSRYSNSEDRRRYQERDRTGNSPSQRYGQHSGEFGSGDYDRGENYFGGGSQTFGSGYSEPKSGRPTNASWRDSSSYGGTSNRYGSGRGYSGMGRDDYRTGYERGYGRSPENDNRRYGSSQYQGSQQYGSNYPSGYPESEAGYYDRSQQGDRGWWDKASDEVSSWLGDEEAAQRRDMDARYGEHRGRGPKNYQRSDERIKEDVNDRLTDHDFLDASEIDVEVSGREVVLTGSVDSREQKRLAEDIAESVSGVTNVENRLRVLKAYNKDWNTTGSYVNPSSSAKYDKTSSTTTDSQTRSASDSH